MNQTRNIQDFDSFVLLLKDKLGIIRTLAVKNKVLDQLKKRGLLCFSLVSVLCACVCFCFSECNANLAQSLCYSLDSCK